jgi:hypothetical protein
MSRNKPLELIPEKKVEQDGNKWAKAHGWWTRKFTSPAHRSVPDRIYGKNGKTVFIEWKRYGEVPTEKQWDELQELREQGFVAEYADESRFAELILRGLVQIPAPDDRSHPGTRLVRSVG